MTFHDMLNRYFKEEEIRSWTSLRKSGYILLPLFIYFLAHDLAEILLWAGIDGLLTKGSVKVSEFLTEHAGTLQGVVNGLMIVVAVAVIAKTVRTELLGAAEERKCLRSAAENTKLPNRKEEEAGVSRSHLYSKTENAPAKHCCKEMRENSNNTKAVQKIVPYLVVAVLAFSSALGLNLLLSLLGIVENSDAYAQAASAQYGVNFFVGLFLYGIVSPFAEEAVFRGVIYQRMKRCFGYLPALFLSSLLFGCYHGNVVQAVYGTVLGMLIACTYEMYGNFALPVLFHALANVSIYVLTCYHSLTEIGKVTGMILTAVLLVVAAGCLWYILYKNKR